MELAGGKGNYNFKKLTVNYLYCYLQFVDGQIDSAFSCLQHFNFKVPLKKVSR